MSAADNVYIGHDEAWEHWRKASAGDRMHHGWILSGKKGVGKSAFAMAAARELVAEEGAATYSGNHPDIIHLTHLPKDDKEAKKRDDGKPYETKRNIAISQIRAMQKRLNTRPTLGDRRVIIVDPADDLETSASNALLKSLEEPPVGSFFILVAHRMGRLLPTIRSRCRILDFPRISDADMQAVLSREAPQADQDMRDAAILAASGSPGAAIDFVELNLGVMHRLMNAIAENGDGDFSLRGQLADAIGARPDRARQLAVVELARAVVAERMRTVQKSAIPQLVETHSELVRLAGQVPTYNFDSGLLIMEIGSQLTRLAVARSAP